MPDYTPYLHFAERLAQEAGEIARKHFSASVGFERKADDSPVTIADTAINQLVIERCKAEYPHIGILGEEASQKGTDATMLWVCDPLDGTVPYSFGLPTSSFCLALVVDGVPQVGVVYDFNQQTLFSAIQGGELMVNGQAHAQGHQNPQKVVNLEGSPRSPHRIKGLYERLMQNQYRVLVYCSCSLMATRVALGRMAAVVYSNMYPWDVAAVKVVAEAAGCKVTDLNGNEQRYDREIAGAIISRPEYFHDIVQIIKGEE